MKKRYVLIAIIMFAILLYVGYIYFIIKKEHMQGYSTLVRKIPEYTAVPNLATSIGGRKGTAYNNSHGLYDTDRSHAITGTPNKANYRRLLLRPQNIGFSYNSIVNRDVYSDFYNNINERRKNPIFKYITKFNGLNLNPARYSLPQYRFAMI